MNDAGRVIILPKGEYVAATTYYPLDAVIYNGNTYVAIGETTGNLPTDETYWKIFVKGATPMQGATAEADGAEGYVPKPLIADKDKFFKGDGTWAETGVSNPNLLDNGWFNVNSRGQSEYTSSGYTVDRWKNFYLESVKINTDKTITLTPNNKDRSFNQLYKIESGKKYTLSIMYADDTIQSVSGIISASQNIAIWNLSKAVNFYLHASLSKISIASSSTTDLQSITIKAIKLELGTVSTLHLDTAPDPEQERLKCMMSTADPNDTFVNKTLQNPTGDEWSPTKTYNVGDMFIAGNQLWKTKVQHSGVIPTEGSYVTKTSVAEELMGKDITQSLLYGKCEYISGSVIRFCNLVVINLRIKISENTIDPNYVSISNLPNYASAKNSATVSLSTPGGDTDNNGAYLMSSGVIAIYPRNEWIIGKEVIISAIYMAN